MFMDAMGCSWMFMPHGMFMGCSWDVHGMLMPHVMFMGCHGMLMGCSWDAPFGCPLGMPQCPLLKSRVASSCDFRSSQRAHRASNSATACWNWRIRRSLSLAERPGETTS